MSETSASSPILVAPAPRRVSSTSAHRHHRHRCRRRHEQCNVDEGGESSSRRDPQHIRPAFLDQSSPPDAASFLQQSSIPDLRNIPRVHEPGRSISIEDTADLSEGVRQMQSLSLEQGTSSSSTLAPEDKMLDPDLTPTKARMEEMKAAMRAKKRARGEKHLSIALLDPSEHRRPGGGKSAAGQALTDPYEDEDEEKEDMGDVKSPTTDKPELSSARDHHPPRQTVASSLPLILSPTNIDDPMLFHPYFSSVHLRQPHETYLQSHNDVDDDNDDDDDDNGQRQCEPHHDSTSRRAPSPISRGQTRNPLVKRGLEMCS